MLCHILIGPSDTVMFATLVIFSLKKTTFAFIFLLMVLWAVIKWTNIDFFGLIIKLISQ